MFLLFTVIGCVMLRGVYDVLCFVFLTCIYRRRRKMNKSTISVETLVPLDTVCSICLTSLYPRFLKLPCEHHFHGGCIDKWLWKHNTCPLCRRLIV